MRLVKSITVSREFNDLQFSARHHSSNTYVKFLPSFLVNDNTALCGSVFTHSDVRKEYIMVKRDPDNNACVVTGVINSGDGSFYPEYHEYATLTGNMTVVDEDDWYFYLPESILPSQFPVRWLVDRLWNIHVKTI
jgi:hypothetical protein